MLSTFLSCVRRRLAVRWNPAICLLAICYCGVARCQEQSDLPTFEPNISTIKLEAPVEEACVGGRGRYLIARLSDRREVVVVDLFQRFVSFTIPLGEDEVELAAGMTRLHVVAPESGLFQSWNLRTGERFREEAWPIEGHVKKIAMGSGNDRAMAVGFADSPHPNESIQWATIVFPSLKVQRLNIGVEPESNFRLQASTDGELFVAWSPQGKPQKQGVAFIKQSRAEWLNWRESPRYIMPDESGSHLLTSDGVFTLQLTEDSSADMEDVSTCVPAMTGPLYLTQRTQDDADMWTLQSLDRRSAIAKIRMDEAFADHAAATAPILGQPFIFSVKAGYIATLTGSAEVALYKFESGDLPTGE